LVAALPDLNASVYVDFVLVYNELTAKLEDIQEVESL
jgi:hypothetical protein